jgi:glutamate/tyrosine decarboxylase-like PLP-dependent enzyme
VKELLNDTAARAAAYLASLESRRVVPEPGQIARLQALGDALQQEPCNPSSVLALLDEYGSPATVANAGGRYFGFVTGSTLPAALAANWLAGAWDQNAGLWVQSPVAAFLEDVTAGWMRDIFHFPSSCGVGFVTGATMANFSCLAAARHALLKRAGWIVEEQGLFGAPEIRVVVGSEVHASVLKALSLVGFGRNRVITVPADEQGRIRADALPLLNDRTLVCIQTGNVNSGAFDPAKEICLCARERGAWVHVDGAFGLWAAAAPRREHLLDGVTDADSWATDCHKWLNVPYDSGVAFVREADHLRNAMALSGAYLQFSDQRDGTQYTPEASRRARGIEIWAALKSLGRRGLAEMIERNCRLAERFALGLRHAGYSILNDVVLNQVLVSFGEAAITRRIIADVQSDGSCWCGGTVWQGHTAMRISVSSWATTEADVDHSLAAILRIAKATPSR